MRINVGDTLVMEDGYERTVTEVSDSVSAPLKAKNYGRKGKNGTWPGCTDKFVNRVEKDRAAAKAARKARKKNRGN